MRKRLKNTGYSSFIAPTVAFTCRVNSAGLHAASQALHLCCLRLFVAIPTAPLAKAVLKRAQSKRFARFEHCRSTRSATFLRFFSK
jgi:hypothetical protein